MLQRRARNEFSLISALIQAPINQNSVAVAAYKQQVYRTLTQVHLMSRYPY